LNFRRIIDIPKNPL